MVVVGAVSTVSHQGAQARVIRAHASAQSTNCRHLCSLQSRLALLPPAPPSGAGASYTVMPNVDYNVDIKDQGGSANLYRCNRPSCCKAMCDARRDCGVFMFGTRSWCKDRCWLKVAPTPAAGPTDYAFWGVTLFVKMAHQSSAGGVRWGPLLACSLGLSSLGLSSSCAVLCWKLYQGRPCTALLARLSA